jgi:hypothetical protein
VQDGMLLDHFIPSQEIIIIGDKLLKSHTYLQEYIKEQFYTAIL